MTSLLRWSNFLLWKSSLSLTSIRYKKQQHFVVEKSWKDIKLAWRGWGTKVGHRSIICDLCDVRNVGQYENEKWYIFSLTSSLWYQKMYAGGSGLRDWFCLLRCIVGVHIHCTTFIVPSFVYWSALLELYIVRHLLCPVVSTHVYSAGVLRFTSKRFLCDIYYWILSTMSSAWDNTYNATIQKHKKINSIKNDHFSPVGDNTSEIDGGSAVNVQVRRTLEPNVRNWGRKVSGFVT